jgi:DNA-binding transcriptional LysR family regulator
MDLDQLHTFLEIVRLKSFSKAAQTCFRTQPAISAQVRQLEQELNTTLFDRLGTRIALTTAGRIFADYSINLELRKQCKTRSTKEQARPRGVGDRRQRSRASRSTHCSPEYKDNFPNIQLQVGAATG